MFRRGRMNGGSMQDHGERLENGIPAETQALLRILELGDAQIAAGEVLSADGVIESILFKSRRLIGGDVYK